MQCLCWYVHIQSISMLIAIEVIDCSRVPRRLSLFTERRNYERRQDIDDMCTSAEHIHDKVTSHLRLALFKKQHPSLKTSGPSGLVLDLRSRRSRTGSTHSLPFSFAMTACLPLFHSQYDQCMTHFFAKLWNSCNKDLLLTTKTIVHKIGWDRLYCAPIPLQSRLFLVGITWRSVPCTHVVCKMRYA